MKQKIIYRAFQKQDIPFITDIIREAWNYDQFSSSKTAKKLSRLFLYSCLANQSYTQVAVENDIPIGIIMGKSMTSHVHPLIHRMKQFFSLASLYLSKEGRKVMKTFESVNHIDKELIAQNGYQYPGEVVFFAVSSSARGKGIGKRLFQFLLEYMKSEKIPRFFLFTDTSCNYGFYEHQGIIRRCEQDTTFYIKEQTATMSFFLYDYEVSPTPQN